jgi:hypothetical protein
MEREREREIFFKLMKYGRSGRRTLKRWTTEIGKSQILMQVLECLMTVSTPFSQIGSGCHDTRSRMYPSPLCNVAFLFYDEKHNSNEYTSYRLIIN